jgi:hypothetical protein
MIAAFGSDVVVNVVASVIASLILLGAGYAWEKYRERKRLGKNLEEYDFYPFSINWDDIPEFNLRDFRLGMHYFLKNNDYTAARQLIFINLHQYRRKLSYRGSVAAAGTDRDLVQKLSPDRHAARRKYSEQRRRQSDEGQAPFQG